MQCDRHNSAQCGVYCTLKSIPLNPPEWEKGKDGTQTNTNLNGAERKLNWTGGRERDRERERRERKREKGGN